MKKYFVIGILLVLFINCSLAQSLPRDKATHLLNDTWMRDPYIVIGPDNFYYLTYTNSKMEMPIWKSENLVEWTKIGEGYTMKNLSFYDDFDRRERISKKENEPVKLWAPEIYYINKNWVATHTSNCRNAVILTSTSVDFAAIKEPMQNNFGSQHDPSIFQDSDGTIWLVSRCAQITKLKSDFSGFEGKPIQISPANRKMGHEGSQILKINGKYVWFGTAWSKDTLRKGTYNLYYATADQVEGPYSDRKFAGRCLGHGTVFQDKDGQWWSTAFYNGEFYKSPEEVAVNGVNPEVATTMNKQGLTLMPLSIETVTGDIVVRALDPLYEKPGAEENQTF